MTVGERSVPLRHLVGALGLVSVAVAATGWSIAWLVTAVLLAGLCRRRGARGLPAALPGAFVVVTVSALVAGLLASAFGVNLLGSVAASRAVLALLSLALGVLAWRAAGDDPVRLALPSRASVLRRGWLAPTLVTVALGAAPVLGPASRYGWIFAGDHLRLMLMAADEWEAGGLTYATNPYPRAIVTLQVLCWTASGGRVDQAGLVSLSRVMACVLWLVLVMVVLGASLVARSAARALDAPPRAAGLAGFLAGWLVLLPMFAADYMARGFESSLVAVACLLAIAVEVLRPWDRRSLVVAASALAVLSHTWQLVLPGAGVGYLVLLWGAVRGGSARQRWSAGVVTVAGAIIALPGVLALLKPVGGVPVSHAASGGDVPTPVLVPLAVVVAAVGYLAWSRRRPAPVVVVLLMGGVTVGLAFVLARSVGVAISSYYPNKILWVGADVLLAFVGIALAVLLVRLDGVGGWRRVGLVPVGLASALVVVVAGLSMLSAPLGSWSTVDGDEVVHALRSPGAGQADVFLTQEPGPFEHTVQIMIRFFHAGSRYGDLPTGSVAEQCAVLTVSRTPTVLTTLDPQVARDRFACVPAVRVVQVTH
ncbi:hypothetical protein ASD62_16570 [Phycicoccus sp. Root563]|uniref:hypothetical protein n=1 Tax=Phycicoccus sp. Root563 TaxID=1736562 RepID=UPI0007257B5D|nr:hypothetical protein [Phycicoccus sp. Root563]KQZ90663.1 hypothetical protein ASD62_16570 [Phycicoccus sp. Root563]